MELNKIIYKSQKEMNEIEKLVSCSHIQNGIISGIFIHDNIKYAVSGGCTYGNGTCRMQTLSLHEIIKPEKYKKKTYTYGQKCQIRYKNFETEKKKCFYDGIKVRVARSKEEYILSNIEAEIKCDEKIFIPMQGELFNDLSQT